MCKCVFFVYIICVLIKTTQITVCKLHLMISLISVHGHAPLQSDASPCARGMPYAYSYVCDMFTLPSSHKHMHMRVNTHVRLLHGSKPAWHTKTKLMLEA